MRPREWGRLAALCAVLGGIFMLASPVAAAPERAADQDKGLVLRGDKRCTECHDESDAPEQLAIGKTKHGTVADKRTPSCVSCHGESERHVKEAGRGSKAAPPVDVGFSSKNPASAEARDAACLACHQGSTRIFWQNSTHSRRDVTCTSCHKIHDGHDKVRQASTQPEVCMGCHKEQRAQFLRPTHHPVPEGAISCSSCHNVHGDNPSQLVKASVNETCFSCHMEKRGPFVHNHQPVAEDCSICHNAHGTNIPNLLKARPPYLCQECHSHESHPGQLAGVPTGPTTNTALLGTAGRGCMNCHTNIHGGNSTINNATAGRFRR
ncbi:DmsE family decaheme c-type cytochrome [Azoarcus sp. KH32C]|uniref:DmsE family decaheme c-type cytochrome n=1 Tax=Azoarcus sp. KH32C TaxID=748247 RepID=UPI0002386F56|nr:DmsE family decaheme c-type cytochrome [Azoarcus sp. KH32C]BAL26650.1 decaheme c-type cytochrome, DmsE family [Azoarcus sp. KH32C]